MKKRIVIVITGLNVGGAEGMLTQLVRLLDQTRFGVEVISLTDLGPKAIELQKRGIPVHAVGMRRGTVGPISFMRLARRLRASRPDIVHTWMYHSDLLGGLAARLVGISAVIWCVRHGTLDGAMSLTTRLVVKACAALSSRVPRRIVMCSEAARIVHQKIGYDASRIRVLPNGVDTLRFAPSPSSRAEVRRDLAIPANADVLAHVARFDPQKDHAGFFRSCKAVLERLPDVHALMCGQGITWENEAIRDGIVNNGLPRGQFHLLDRRTDVERLFAAADVAISSSSYGESFPNVLAEAMACGIPCVATDVGGSADIVGDAGRIVPPRDAFALAEGIVGLLQGEPEVRQALGGRARERVERCFNLPDIVSRYEALYDEVLAEAGTADTVRATGS